MGVKRILFEEFMRYRFIALGWSIIENQDLERLNKMKKKEKREALDLLKRKQKKNTTRINNQCRL